MRFHFVHFLGNHIRSFTLDADQQLKTWLPWDETCYLLAGQHTSFSGKMGGSCDTNGGYAP